MYDEWVLYGKKHRYYVIGSSYPHANDSAHWAGKVEKIWADDFGYGVVDQIRFNFKSQAAATNWVRKQKVPTQNKIKRYFKKLNNSKKSLTK